MDTVFLNLLNRSIAACWLILAVVVLRFFLQKAPKWIRYILWTLVAFRLICPFTPESIFSLIPSAEPLPESLITGNHFRLDTGMAVADSPADAALADRYYEEVTAADSGSRIFTILGWIWFAGVLVLCLQSVVSYIQLKRRVRAAVPFGENIWIGDSVDTPFVMGLFRPRIYLPSDMVVNGDMEQIDYVLAHEKTHVKHLDHWWKPLGFIVLMIYWFHPLVWLSYVLFCRDMELACDERVIREYDMARKKAYSSALLACSIRQKRVAACPVAFGEVGVKTRIKAVLQYKKPGFWILFAALLVCLAAAVCFLTNPRQELSLPENPIVYQTDLSSGEYLALVDGDRYYVPYAAIGLTAAGECIGYYEITGEQENSREYICTFAGYDAREWIVSIPGLKNCNEAMLFREIHVMEQPEGMASEYSWNIMEASESDAGAVDLQDPSEAVALVTQMPGEFVIGSRNMTLEDVILLSAKGWELTWADFDGFSYYDTGSGLIIHIYLIDQDFSLWAGGDGSQLMYIYLQENATEERIDIREENVEAFIAVHAETERGDVAVRLPLADAVQDVSGIWLGKADAAVISGLVNAADWQDGTTDCIGSHVFMIEGENLQYHAECGTFNDPGNNRHFTLAEEQRGSVNVLLIKYIQLPVQVSVTEF